MLGNFSYYNPTKLYFGDESLNFLKDELKGYGPVVLLNYGSGSVKRNGIYDQVIAILREAGKTIVENPGVMTNPTLEKLNEGVKIARENNVDLILALGGGSVCDYSKAVAASVYYDGDYWDKFWLKQEQPDADQKLLPVGRNRLGDECWHGDYRRRAHIQGGPRVRQPTDAEVLYSESEVHNDRAREPDEGGYLRHYESHHGAVLLRL